MEILIPFHDWVYLPGSKTNEIESADAATYWLTMVMGLRPDNQVSGMKIGQIPRIILDTQHHSDPQDNLEALFFDMDLSGLGDTDNYAKTSAQVRDEFVPYVGLAAYREGRAEWLRGMLKRPVLFHTLGFKHLDEPARENMEREVIDLTKSTGHLEY
jgi:predicted metal-dependent HD superfamily phosphohydrolase